jgi:hypothetical protein
MISERFKTAGRLWPLLLLLLAGCGSGEVRVCPDENDSLLSDGTVRVQQFRAVSDPTAGGRLQGASPQGRNRPTKLVLLLDYSGSMFGGYGKPRNAGCALCAAGLDAAGKPVRGGQPYYFEVPAFDTLLAHWLDAATPPGSRQDLEILLFNTRVWRLGDHGVEPFGNPSQLDFARPVGTANAGQIAAWLRQIPGSPYQVDSTAANTTESEAALRAVLDAIGDEAIIWLITDNIVDRGSGVVSEEDARRNLNFYNTLQEDPRVQMIAAYPLHKADPCSWMCGTSLFAYGLYVSRSQRPESTEFHRLGGTTPDGGGPTADGLLWNKALSSVAAEYGGKAAGSGRGIAGVPLRLKPVDTEVLSFDFALHRGQALLCDARAEYGDILRCVVRATVRNTLRHQKVDSAKLRFNNQTLLPRKPDARFRLQWASAVCASQMHPVAWRVDGGPGHSGDDPIEIGPLAPLASTVVDVVFELPAVEVDTRHWKHIPDVAFTERILLDGRITAEIRDIRTSLDVDTAGMEEVYGAPELPSIFRGQEMSRIEAVYPAGAVISNNGQLLGLLVLLGGGGLVLLLSLVAMRFQRLHLTILINGVEHAKIGMPRLSYEAIAVGGKTRAILVRGWGSDYKLRPRSGYKLRKDGTSWLLVPPGGGEEIRIDVRRGWGAGRRSSRTAVRDGW